MPLLLRYKNLPKEVVFFEIFLFLCGLALILGSGTAVIKIWLAEPWSLTWVTAFAMIVLPPVVAAWMYLGDLHRDRFLPLWILASWAAGIVLAVVAHYGIAGYRAWVAAHPFFLQ